MKYTLLIICFISAIAQGQKKDSTKTLQDIFNLNLDTAGSLRGDTIRNLSLFATTKPSWFTLDSSLSHTYLLIVVQNQKDIIRVDGNGDLYFNPHLLMKQDYMKDTMVLWGNIYTSKWTDASKASRDTMVIYHY